MPTNISASDVPVALNDLYPLVDFVARNPAITMSTLRHQLRRREQNGLAAACVWAGKKLLISKSRYEAWLGAQMGAGKREGGRA